MTAVVVPNQLDLSATSEAWRKLASYFVQDGHDDLPATRYGLQRLFAGVDFAGKRVLDIGSGRGLMSLYAGACGAAQVTSMEPELDGSTSGVIATLTARRDEMGLDNVEPVIADFNTWPVEPAAYDVVMSFAAINHIRESSHNARTHKPTRDAYANVIARMSECLVPGGLAIVTDVRRYGLFFFAKRIGIRRPWTKRRSSINWKVHQEPTVWRRLFLENGFSKVAVQYPVPHRLRHVAPLVNNSVANFMFQAKFALTATK